MESPLLQDFPDLRRGVGRLLHLPREIVVPERIVYTDQFADQWGNLVPPAHYGMSPGHPPLTLVTVIFGEKEGMSTVTVRHCIPASVKERGAVDQGWNEMLDRLSDYLRSAPGQPNQYSLRKSGARRCQGPERRGVYFAC